MIPVAFCTTCLDGVRHFALETLPEMLPGRWREVVFIADLDEDGFCPHCRAAYTECPCPGPPQDGIEYKIFGRPDEAPEDAQL